MEHPTARRNLILGVAITILGIATLVIVDAYYLNWSWTGLGPKTLWDWLELLIIPIVLASGGLWFSRQEKRYEQQIAANRSHDEALQAYLDKMTELLLKEKLRTSTESDEVRSVARARTLTVLRRLDKEGRIAVLRFLIESHLIEANKPIISFSQSELDLYDLSGANLSRANLSRANLSGANLKGTYLFAANLSETFMRKTNLSEAHLTAADLSEAYLNEADLSAADLSGANLSGTQLVGAYLSGANLSRADLSRTNFIGANLSGANLSEANLEGAHLTAAILTKANLTKAKLSGADLESAYLSGAILEGANLEDAKLEGTILRGANLPSSQHQVSTPDKSKSTKPENPTESTKASTP